MGKPIEPGSPAAAIVEAEERLHAQVQARLALGPAGSGGAVDSDKLDRELIELRDALAEAKPEDLAPLVEQMTRTAALRDRVGRSRALPVDPASPYFAHMVVRDGTRARDVLIGKRGFIDREANVQIVDWRNAPISQIYYRYDEGDDFDEEIGGRRLAGVVDVRRNVSIAGGRLRRIGAPQGTFVRDARNVWHEAVGSMVPALQGGAGKAARAPVVARHGGRGRARRRLGVHHGGVHRADKHLPEIAALIDKEQFALITRPDAGLLVIQGGAGSGKTTVALHRIAYLNFADRNRFAPDKVLVVVPSDALARYVEGVLPALGVRGVPVVTYARWAQSMRRRMLPETSPRAAAEPPHEIARLKKHPGLVAAVDALVARQVAAVDERLSGAALDAWRGLADRAPVPRLRALLRWVRDGAGGAPPAERAALESEILAVGKRMADIVTDWAELLTDRGALRDALARGGEPATDRDIDALVDWCARQVDSDDAPALDPDGAPIHAADGRAADDDSVAGRFDAYDDAILLRLVQLKRGGLVAPGGKRVAYEHVAIDEAQDRSAMEIKLLVEAARAPDGDPRRRSVTIAGDTAQRLVFDNGFTDWPSLLAHVGYPGVAVEPLRLSYRSTAEVMQLARDILGPELAPAEPLMARPGAPVELHEFSDTGEAVAFLADALRALASREPSASVAVVARYAAQVDAYYAGLRRAEVPALRRVRDGDFSFRPGVDVTDVAQVKGLEFDYVVLVDVNAASYPDTVESRHLLHIGATRAAHQLWLVSTGEPSPLVTRALSARETR